MLKAEGFKMDLNWLLNMSEGLWGVTMPCSHWAPPNKDWLSHLITSMQQCLGPFLFVILVLVWGLLPSVVTITPRVTPSRDRSCHCATCAVILWHPVAPLHLANATCLVLSGDSDKFDNLPIILGFIFLSGCL